MRCQLVRAPGVKVTSVALVRDGACGVAIESCRTVPVKLLLGAAFVARLPAGRIVTSSMVRLHTRPVAPLGLRRIA